MDSFCLLYYFWYPFIYCYYPFVKECTTWKKYFKRDSLTLLYVVVTTELAMHCHGSDWVQSWAASLAAQYLFVWKRFVYKDLLSAQTQLHFSCARSPIRGNKYCSFLYAWCTTINNNNIIIINVLSNAVGNAKSPFRPYLVD